MAESTITSYSTFEKDGKHMVVATYSDGTTRVVGTYATADAATNAQASLQGTLTARQNLQLTLEMENMKIDSGTQLAWENYELSKERQQAQIERMPELSGMAQDYAQWQLDTVQAKQNEAFFMALNDIIPNWREDYLGTATDAQVNTNALMKHVIEEVTPAALDAVNDAAINGMAVAVAQLQGATDPAAQAMLRGQMTELYEGIQNRTQAKNSLTNRDLGLTRNQQFMRGQQTLAQAQQGAIAGYGGAMQNLQTDAQITAANSALSRAFVPQVANVYGIYENYLNALQGKGTLSADTILQANVSMAGSGVQSAANMFNAVTSFNQDIAGTLQAQQLAMMNTGPSQTAQFAGMAMGAALGGASAYAGYLNRNPAAPAASMPAGTGAGGGGYGYQNTGVQGATYGSAPGAVGGPGVSW